MRLRSFGVMQKLSVGSFWTISYKNFFRLFMQSSLNLFTTVFIPYILQILKMHWEAALDTNRF